MSTKLKKNLRKKPIRKTIPRRVRLKEAIPKLAEQAAETQEAISQGLLNNGFEDGVKLGPSIQARLERLERENMHRRHATPIDKYIDEIRTMFQGKNRNYRSDADPFANFHQSAPVTKGVISKLTYCLTLAAKQDDAAWTFIARNTGYIGQVDNPRDPEFRERIIDGVVYRLIALALLDEPS